MIDLRKTVIPKSDQLNADDLIGQTKTIKVTKVSLLTEADQPIAIGYEDDGGKPYKPCKSMRRVLVNIWGPDGNAYIGRSMTIYRDDKVMFGGVNVGGIRISNMSHIDGPVTMALTVTRANRKPFTVQPLATQPPTPPHVTNGVPADVLAVRALGDEAAAAGMDSLRKFWTGLSKAGKVAVGNGAQLAAWKAIAEAADAPDVEFDDKSPLGDRFYREPDPVVISGTQQVSADSAATDDPAPVPQHEPAGRHSRGTGLAEAPPELGRQSVDQASQGALGAASADPPAGAASTLIAARKSEIRKDGEARAAAGTAALTDFLEALRKAGEADLVSTILRDSWNDTAKAADAAKGRKST